VGSFAFKIFFVHILNVPIMLVLAMLMVNIKSLGIEIPEDTIQLIIFLFCFVFYVLFVYIEAWRTGERDHNLVLYSRIKYNKFKALYASAVSQIPGFVLSVLLLITGSFNMQKFARYFYLNFIYHISYFDAEPYNMKIVYFIPILFAVIPAVLGYFLGYSGIRILDRLMFVNTGNRDKKDLR
jgi:hypothetical protein